MARINTNVSSMIAQSNLSRTNGDLNVRLQRLSTGLRINRGADDPAGLIVSERLRIVWNFFSGEMVILNIMILKTLLLFLNKFKAFFTN